MIFKKLNPLDNLSFKQLDMFINLHKPIMLLLSLVCIICLINAGLTINWIEWWKIFLIYYFIGTIEQIFYHRRFAHKSWQAPKWLDFIGLWLSSLSLLGNPIAYVAHHRVHHKFADTPLDPHTPYHHKWWKIVFLFPYYKGSLKYSFDLCMDDMQRFSLG